MTPFYDTVASLGVGIIGIWTFFSFLGTTIALGERSRALGFLGLALSSGLAASRRGIVHSLSFSRTRSRPFFHSFLLVTTFCSFWPRLSFLLVMTFLSFGSRLFFPSGHDFSIRFHSFSTFTSARSFSCFFSHSFACSFYS